MGFAFALPDLQETRITGGETPPLRWQGVFIGWGDPAPTMARCVYRAGRPALQ